MSTQRPELHVKRTGPIEEGSFPEKLSLHVIDLESTRMHGYAIVDDLAAYLQPSACTLLAYLGELPTPEQLAIFEAAQVYVQIPFVLSADVHAGILAKICGARPATLVAAVVTSSAEDCERRLLAYGESVGAFASGNMELSPGDETCAAAEAVVAKAMSLALKACSERLSSMPEVNCFGLWLRAMVAIGITKPIYLTALWSDARKPALLAEASCIKAGSFADYPIHLPRIDFCSEVE
jgi:hypothetical protein